MKSLLLFEYLRGKSYSLPCMKFDISFMAHKLSSLQFCYHLEIFSCIIFLQTPFNLQVCDYTFWLDSGFKWVVKYFYNSFVGFKSFLIKFLSSLESLNLWHLIFQCNEFSFNNCYEFLSGVSIVIRGNKQEATNFYFVKKMDIHWYINYMLFDRLCKILENYLFIVCTELGCCQILFCW